VPDVYLHELTPRLIVDWGTDQTVRDSPPGWLEYPLLISLAAAGYRSGEACDQGRRVVLLVDGLPLLDSTYVRLSPKPHEGDADHRAAGRQIEQPLLVSAARRAIKVATMTQATVSHTMAGRTSLPLRRVDGIELPVAGTWIVPGNHAAIAFSVPRRLRQPDSRSGRASEATVFISEDPDDVLVAVLFDVPGLEISGSPVGTISRPIHLEARSVPGPHRWVLSGEVFSDTGAVPLRATMSYHGVWRRGELTYGWFVLAGAIGAGRRTTRPLRFSFELLASAPEPWSHPLPAPSRSRSVRATSQRGAAA
jgi:hypothetical protein